MKKKSKYIILILIIALAALFVLYAFLNKGGREVHPNAELPVDNAVFYCQRDEKWANSRLGDSEYTMADSGCLTSCLAAALTMQGMEETNPAALNMRFSKENIYDSEGNIQWEAAENVLGRTIARKEALSSEELDNLLGSGMYPIVHVKINGMTGHFVLLIGAENGEYLCMDPLNENTTPVPLSSFGDKIYWVRYLEN